MFFRKEEYTRDVYKMRTVGMFLLLIPFVGSLTIAFHSSFPNSVLILNPTSPATSWILCFLYPYGLRLVHPLAPFTSFAVFPTITPFSLLILTIYVVSWVLFIALSRDFLFIKLLMDAEGYERYKEVRNFIRTLVKQSTTEEKLCVFLEPILSLLGFVISTGIPLSYILLLEESTRLTITFSLFLIIFFYAVDTFYLKRIVKRALR